MAATDLVIVFGTDQQQSPFHSLVLGWLLYNAWGKWEKLWRWFGWAHQTNGGLFVRQNREATHKKSEPSAKCMQGSICYMKELIGKENSAVAKIDGPKGNGSVRETLLLELINASNTPKVELCPNFHSFHSSNDY